jgi:hypothetical protein
MISKPVNIARRLGLSRGVVREAVKVGRVLCCRRFPVLFLRLQLLLVFLCALAGVAPLAAQETVSVMPGAIVSISPARLCI